MIVEKLEAELKAAAKRNESVTGFVMGPGTAAYLQMETKFWNGRYVPKGTVWIKPTESASFSPYWFRSEPYPGKSYDVVVVADFPIGEVMAACEPIPLPEPYGQSPFDQFKIYPSHHDYKTEIQQAQQRIDELLKAELKAQQEQQRSILSKLLGKMKR